MIGDKIKELRQLKGYTQLELAKKVGYTSKATINKIELNINDVQLSKVEAFAKALDVTPGYLMGWEDEEEEPAVIDIDAEIEQLLSRINSGGGISVHGETLDDTTKELLVDSLTNTLKLINALSKNS